MPYSLSAQLRAAEPCTPEDGHLGETARFGLRTTKVYANALYEETGQDRKGSLRLDAGVITGTGIRIEPKPEVKILGVLLDQRLTWRSQRENLTAKATKAISAMTALASSTRGLTMSQLRILYNAIVMSRLLYCALAWYTPQGGSGNRGKETQAIAMVKRVQARGAKAMTGCFRTVAGSALDIESYLLPAELRLKTTIFGSYLRMVEGPIRPLTKNIRALPERKRNKGYVRGFHTVF